MKEEKKLSELCKGECARVCALLTERLVVGTVVECVGKSPCGDPAAYRIRGAVIAIRSEDAKTVCVR